MEQNSNETVKRLAALYYDIRKVESTIDRISHHNECSPGIRYEVLKPFKLKLLWFRNAMEAKLADQIDLKAYWRSQHESTVNDKIMRMLTYMTTEQRQFTSNLISGMLEGKVIKLTLAEEPDEEIF